MELHIVFNYSAVVDIRKVLAGRDAAVARFSDNLSYGPINPPEPTVRRSWIKDQIGFDNPDITDDVDTFWPKALAKNSSRIAWVSRCSAAEYCGFLEYLWRLGDLPTKIIDTTYERNSYGGFFRSTGSIPANYILSNGLLNTAHQIDGSTRSGYLALWEKLRAENSALRVVGSNLALSSAPLSFYDQKLLSLAGNDWRPMADIVGDFLDREAVSDLLPFSRLYALVDAGTLAERDAGRRHPDVKLAES